MKKYAFVSDFVRLYALYHQGGIYMDTDVMLLKKLDDYLKHQAFSGFEDKSKISTGIMGAEKGNELMGRLLDYYDTAQFFKSDGRPDLTTNVETITSMLLPLGLVPNGEFQIVSGMALYPQNIFCPDHKRLQDSRYMADAVTIHYFAGSWKSEKTRKRENSFVWRVLAKPATWSSRVLRFFFGNRWIAVKDKILERIKRGE